MVYLENFLASQMVYKGGDVDHFVKRLNESKPNFFKGVRWIFLIFNIFGGMRGGGWGGLTEQLTPPHTHTPIFYWIWTNIWFRYFKSFCWHYIWLEADDQNCHQKKKKGKRKNLAFHCDTQKYPSLFNVCKHWLNLIVRWVKESWEEFSVIPGICLGEKCQNTPRKHLVLSMNNHKIYMKYILHKLESSSLRHQHAYTNVIVDDISLV